MEEKKTEILEEIQKMRAGDIKDVVEKDSKPNQKKAKLAEY